MKVKNLIKKLQEVNAELPVTLIVKGGCMGSSKTGWMESEDIVEVEDIRVIDGDDFAGLTPLDRAVRIEIITDDSNF